MKLSEAIERIRFNTSTLDDLSGKAINSLFTNRDIVRQLTYALDKYAMETQAIEGIYSMVLNTEVQSIQAPPLALRAKGYRFIIMWVNQYKWMVDISNLNDANTYFPIEYSGIPRWVIPFQDELYLYPNLSQAYATTDLAQPINKTDTTIYLESGSNFIIQNGRVSIGEEKIRYAYREGNVFYNCERGIEDTLPSNHNIGDSVNENNLHIFYFKLNWRIPMVDANRIDPYFLNKQLEVCDEHMEMITDYTSYKLLSKIDKSRGEFYKFNFEEWLQSAKSQIKRGRSQIKNAGDIRGPFPWEGPSAYGFLA